VEDYLWSYCFYKW